MLTDNAIRILEERYLLPDETSDQMFWRVADYIASAEKLFDPDIAEEAVRRIAKDFYILMSSLRFLPNSPTLMNAGANNNLQLSACYVLPIEDSLAGIFETIKQAALIHKSGGGTGFSFSRLRAKGAHIASSSYGSSGPISFLKVFDAATESVKQSGKRRGANMGVLRVDHPSIEEFITCKKDGGIQNFNISVAITDKFMEALLDDTTFSLREPSTGKLVGTRQAEDIWDLIVDNAWETGDPGIVFIDRVNQSSANPIREIIEAPNPCGEQYLPPYSSCNLGSIDVSKYYNPKGGHFPIDIQKLSADVGLAVRFLDNVIECNQYPLPELDKAAKESRRIGLGVMGWSDLLMEARIPYDSEEALGLARALMCFIDEKAWEASIQLAEERGEFPRWQDSKWRDATPGQVPRNATVTTIAPTGSISIIAGCSSGIEPAFALAYNHTVGGRVMEFMVPAVKDFIETCANAGNRKACLDYVRDYGTMKGALPMVVGDDELRVFATANEIPVESHIQMQAAFQTYISNGVSKTINLPNSATRDDVSKAYLVAYELGCLGTTIFRDGCRDVQVLTTATKPKEVSPTKHTITERDGVLAGQTYRIATPLGNAYITLNEDQAGNLFEVFCNIGKVGSDTAAVSEGLGRLLSLILRMPSQLTVKERIAEIIEQLQDIGGRNSVGFGSNKVQSLPDAFAQVLRSYVVDKISTLGQELVEQTKSGDICASCGNATLVREEGCYKCHSCGYSKC